MLKKRVRRKWRSVMATNRENEFTISDDGLGDGYYASRYVHEIWAATKSPYFLLGTAAVALPAKRPLEIGFFRTYGVIVMTPALHNVVFLPPAAAPS
jgi:hypothetical protein